MSDMRPWLAQAMQFQTCRVGGAQQRSIWRSNQMAQLRQAVTQNPRQLLELIEDGYALSVESLALLRERAAEARAGGGDW